MSQDVALHFGVVADQFVIAAEEALSKGRPESAERSCDEALAQDPAHERAIIVKALCRAQVNRPDEGIALLEEFVRARPDSFAALCELSGALRSVGKDGQAEDAALRAISLRSTSAEGYVHLGLAFAATQRFEQAVVALEAAVQREPSNGICHYHLGSALRLLGREQEGVDELRAAVTLLPGFVPAQLKLGQALLGLGRRQEAIDRLEAVLRLDPRVAEAHILLAEALTDAGRTEEADRHMEHAARLDPSTGTQRGFRLQVLGRFDDACRCFEGALEARPWDGAAFYGLVGSKTVQPDDAEFVERHSLLTTHPAITARERMLLHYGLGKAYEDLHRPELALRHFHEANGVALANQRLQFDTGSHKASIDWRIDTFTRGYLQGRASDGNPSEMPIFVVGMIRSGTTLVEQALSSHPSIAAGGELRFWYEKQRELNEEIGLGAFDREALNAMSEQCMELLSNLGLGAKRVVDKMPMNFLLLGIVHLAFPRARIIHCRRDPVDNCVSIYTTHFDTSPPYAHMPENIAAYYLEYERLMAHWRQVLPNENLLEVRYEDVVAEREATLRRMVDFAGLPWDEACLHHEANPRSVRTPSVWQVRQPIYSSSVGRGKRFGALHNEFEALLGQRSGTVAVDAA